MNNPEFSNEFDLLASSYLNEGGFTISDSSILAFNEYEKSVFLTQAQEKYIISLYNGKNASGESFEKTEEMRRYLHNIVAEYYTETPVSGDAKNYIGNNYHGMNKHESSLESTFFQLPEDLWFITYESVQTKPNEAKPKCDGGYSIIQDVLPVTQDEFHRIKRNPFRGPSYRRALRLDLSDATIKVTDGRQSHEHTGGIVEIISKYPIGSYYVRYIKKVEPIILIDLPDGLEINGNNKTCECKLHEATHRDILELAVRLAIASRSITNSSKSSKDND